MGKLFRKRRDLVLLLLLCLFCFVGAPFLASWFFSRPVNKQGQDQIFVIRRGENTYQIASRLEQDHLIRNRHIFLLALRYYGLKGKIQAGSFRLSPQMNIKELAFSLTKGRLDQWVTIVEGLRREEIASQLEKELGVPSKEFLQASRGKEGYLFPDSYLLPRNISAAQLVKIMVANFQKRTEGLWDKAAQKKLTKREAVIIASLVEREAKTRDDRQIVAGVLIKRWQSQWPLQVDATVQYAKASLAKGKKGGWWPTLAKADLQISSPFNTYLHAGLPPAPICNPSLESIEAAVDYEITPYWFYLSDPSGKTHFSKSLEKHKENIDNYLKNR